MQLSCDAIDAEEAPDFGCVEKAGNAHGLEDVGVLFVGLDSISRQAQALMYCGEYVGGCEVAVVKDFAVFVM